MNVVRADGSTQFLIDASVLNNIPSLSFPASLPTVPVVQTRPDTACVLPSFLSVLTLSAGLSTNVLFQMDYVMKRDVTL